MDTHSSQLDFQLREDDPLPYQIVDGNDPLGLLLVCDHAGRHLPAALRDRAPSEAEMQTHAASDVGAVEVARRVAALVDAPLISQPYSRLVIDPNRPRQSHQLAPAISDGIVVPFNQDLTEEQIEYRWRNIHQPYHNQIQANLDNREKKAVALVAIHSFTPQLRDGEPRPWHIDLIVRRPSAHFEIMPSRLQACFHDLKIGINQVFQIDDNSDYTIPVHAETRGIPHVSMEIRNDMIATQAAISKFADAIAGALTAWLTREFGKGTATLSESNQ